MAAEPPTPPGTPPPTEQEAQEFSPQKKTNPLCEALLPLAVRFADVNRPELLLGGRSRDRCTADATVEAVHFLTGEKFARFCPCCWRVLSIFLPEYDGLAL